VRATSVVLAGLSALFILSGCQERKEVTTTTGAITVECDEAVAPLIRAISADFQITYPNSEISIRPASVQNAVLDFINDSTQMIATGRPLNDRELKVIAEAGLEYKSFNIAIDAVAVILNSSNPVREMRMSELDSMLAGKIIHWRPWGGTLYPVQLALGSGYSSTTQIVQEQVMHGGPFSPAALYFDTTPEVLNYVKQNENALGIVSLAWLQGTQEEVTVVALGEPGSSSDPGEPSGSFYKPFQAHVYRHYYPITTKVYFYNREIQKTVGLGLIAYTNNIQGQRIVQSSGLVPATIPVRLVETTSRQVTE